SKLHVSLGHETAMAQLTAAVPGAAAPTSAGRASSANTWTRPACGTARLACTPCWSPASATVIVSKLDVDINQNVCRIAMHGRRWSCSTSADYRTGSAAPKLVRSLPAKVSARPAGPGQQGRIERLIRAERQVHSPHVGALSDEFCQRYGGGKRAKKRRQRRRTGASEPVASSTDGLLDYESALFLDLFHQDGLASSRRPLPAPAGRPAHPPLLRPGPPWWLVVNARPDEAAFYAEYVERAC
uniref:VPS13 domain-containing protein n=1 Tax=Macrostomum lignano TaxID=282301 RepID=A0A1I8FA24_9PLAT